MKHICNDRYLLCGRFFILNQNQMFQMFGRDSNFCFKAESNLNQMFGEKEKNSGQAWLIFNRICSTHSSGKKPPIKNSDSSDRGQKVELTQASTRNRKMFDDPKKRKTGKTKLCSEKNCPRHILMKIVKSKLSYNFIGKVRCLLKEVNLHVGVWIKLNPSLT